MVSFKNTTYKQCRTAWSWTNWWTNL